MTAKLFDLNGRIALLTGATQGLGFAMARGLGEAGAIVVLNGRNEEKLERAVLTLSKEGLSVHPSLFDVRDESQIKENITEVDRKIGPILLASTLTPPGRRRRSTGPPEATAGGTARSIGGMPGVSGSRTGSPSARS